MTQTPLHCILLYTVYCGLHWALSYRLLLYTITCSLHWALSYRLLLYTITCSLHWALSYRLNRGSWVISLKIQQEAGRLVGIKEAVL